MKIGWSVSTAPRSASGTAYGRHRREQRPREEENGEPERVVPDRRRVRARRLETADVRREKGAERRGVEQRERQRHARNDRAERGEAPPEADLAPRRARPGCERREADGSEDEQDGERPPAQRSGRRGGVRRRG